MTWVIYKKTREPGRVSYDGPTWDEAGIRNLWKNSYEDKTEAMAIALVLSTWNLVGFDVHEIKDQTQKIPRPAEAKQGNEKT